MLLQAAKSGISPAIFKLLRNSYSTLNIRIKITQSNSCRPVAHRRQIRALKRAWQGDFTSLILFNNFLLVAEGNCPESTILHGIIKLACFYADKYCNVELEFKSEKSEVILFHSHDDFSSSLLSLVTSLLRQLTVSHS